jgi:hypothetical protein
MWGFPLLQGLTGFSEGPVWGCVAGLPDWFAALRGEMTGLMGGMLAGLSGD